MPVTAVAAGGQKGCAWLVCASPAGCARGQKGDGRLPEGSLPVSRIVVLGGAFAVILVAYVTTQNYMSVVLGADAFRALTVSNFTFAGCTLLAPIAVHKLGLRLSMCLGAASVLVWTGGVYAAAALGVRWPLFLGSTVLGALCPILWTAQGAYVTAASTQATRGSYNGLFFALASMNPIVGNGLAIALVNGAGLPPTFVFGADVLIAALGLLAFFAVTDVASRTEAARQPHEPPCTAALHAALSLPRIVCSRDFGPLAPACVFLGFSKAFVFGTFTQLVGEFWVGVCVRRVRAR